MFDRDIRGIHRCGETASQSFLLATATSFPSNEIKEHGVCTGIGEMHLDFSL